MKVKKKLSEKILDYWMTICERRKKTYYSRQIEKELGGLFPGCNRMDQIRIYYEKKIDTGLKVVAAGIVVVLMCICNVLVNGDLKQGKILEKNGLGGGTRTVVLDAEIQEINIEDLQVEVEEMKLSDDDVQKKLNEIAENLPKRILGKNENTDHIDQPLELINLWDDQLVSIYWTSSNYGVLREDGSFGTEEIPKEGKEVTLTALLSYDGTQRKENISVKVFPEVKTEQELMKESLIDLIEIQKEVTKTEKYLELPVKIDQISIQWKEKKQKDLIPMICLVFVAVFVVLWGKDKEIHTQYENRNRELELEYSEFVSKLQLLVCSGMSMRNAFTRLGKDYLKQRERGGNKKYVYEELMVVVRKMENGMAELEAYEYFGKRCDLLCYKKLASIIVQNVRKGTIGLKESLSAEVKTAFEERKQLAKRLGEEAGTKLLLPMMMMMGVVLMIIVIPAYFSFGGI